MEKEAAEEIGQEAKTDLKVRRLYRSCNGRFVGGVAGGIAEYLDVDSTLVRLITLVILFTGAGLLLYLIAWIVIPENPECAQAGQSAQPNSGERGGRAMWGLFLVGLGLLFLLQTAFSFDFGRLWPLILIVLGIAVIMGRERHGG